MSGKGEIRGYYGYNERTGLGTEATIYTYSDGIHTWYAVEGSTSCNCTGGGLLVNGVNIETLGDFDTFEANNPIESEDDLEREVDDYLHG